MNADVAQQERAVCRDKRSSCRNATVNHWSICVIAQRDVPCCVIQRDGVSQKTEDFGKGGRDM